MKTPEPVGQQGRWLDLLSEYDITIQHRPGRIHGNSDTLSRHPCERGTETDCQQCPRATQTHTAKPISSVALLVDGFASFCSTHKLTSLQTCPPPNCRLTSHLTFWRRRNFRFCRMRWHMLRQQMTSRHGLNCSESPLDEIREAQSIDDSLQLVTQALVDKVKPPRGSLCDYPEEARVLFSQWDSLVLEEGVLYRRYHYPDSTTKYLQMVLPVKFRRPYVEHLHADLGHFGRAKTCMAIARCAHFLDGVLSLECWYRPVRPVICISEATRGRNKLT